MTRLVNDIVTRLYLNSDWRDISSDVRAAGGVAIKRGSGSEDDAAPPQTCSLTLDNTSGDYTERDPMGQWYGYLGQNTPLEMSLRLAKDTATTTVVNGWGSMDTDTAGAWTAYAWTTADGAASDYQKTGGKATHLISVANTGKNCLLANFSQRDIDVTSTITISASNITGGAIAADYLIRMQGFFSNYYYVRLLVDTNESVNLDIGDPTLGSLSGSAVVSGITHTSSQALKFRVQAEGRTIRAKAWVATSSEPYDWGLTYTDEGTISAGTVALMDSAGAFAIRSLAGSGNTNVPVTVSFDDIEIRTPAYFGEVAEWPQTRDVSGNDRTVEIEAGGVTRRLSQGQSPQFSAPRRAIPNDTNCTYYWPLEEGPLATTGAPVVGTPYLLSLSLGVGSASAFGDGELAPWLPNGPIVQNEVLGVAAYTLNQPLFTAANGWRVEYYRQARNVDDAGDSFYVSDNTDGLWLVTIDHGTGNVSIVSPYSTVTTTYPDLTSGEGAWIKFVVQGSGTVTWKLYMNDVLVLSSSAAGSAQAVRQIVFTGGERGLAIGHIAIYHTAGTVGLLSPYLGHRGETALARMRRLCSENSVSFSYLGSASDTATVGPQGVETLLDLLAECSDTDAGMLYEPRGTSGLVYRTRTSLYTRSSWATLSMADGELSPPWVPVPDDRYRRNKITARQQHGGNYTYALATGRLSVLSPELGGAGIYDDSVDLNVYSDTQLPDQAAWRVHLGTIDEERYPEVVVELHRTQIKDSNPTLYARLLDLDAGDQITLTDLDATGIYDDPEQIVIGYKRILTRFTHTLRMVCAPASGYRVATTNDSNARIDAESSYLDVAVNSTATALSVRTQAARWTTDAGDLPVDIKISGERMTATAIGSATPTFVAAGTAAHADNASVVPGLPAGLAAGDTLFLVAAIRNTGTGVPVAPSGYGTLASTGGLYLFAKTATSSESAPTVTFTGGVSGATCTAQLAAFRGVSLSRANANGQSNASAQDIGFPQLTLPNPEATHLVLHIGWKQDDWTSVATLTGSTEIGEPSSTLGSDQGIVWDYRVVSGVHAVDSGSFVVTGGASAVSIGIVNAQYCTQAFTVTRSVNGVVKSQAYNSEVHVADPYYIGL